MFFKSVTIFRTFAFVALVAFFACNKAENTVPDKLITPAIPVVSLPKLMKSGPQDSIPEQDIYEYNTLGQLVRIKEIYLEKTFSYTNGLLISQKVTASSALQYERKYEYKNGLLTSYKEYYPTLPDDHYTLFEVVSVDTDGFPTVTRITYVTPTQQTVQKTITYVWKNGNVVSADMKSNNCNQSATMEYDDKMTPWHQFQNPLKNPHFLDSNFGNMSNFYSKNNEVTYITPHCSNTETSYSYNNLGLPTTAKINLSGNNGFSWSRTLIRQYQ
jgi:hypothetical protein